MGLSEADALAAMGQAVAERGLLPQATVDAELAAFTGATASALPQPDALPPTVDDGADEVLDADLFQPPATQSAYQLALPGMDLTATVVAELGDIGAAIFDAGLPVPIVTAIRDELAASIKSPPTEQTMELQRQHTMMRLRKAYGPDIDKALAVARAEYRRIVDRVPSLGDALHRAGLENSEFVIRSLVANARAKRRT